MSVKQIDWNSLELDDIDPRDCPDFSDAYFSFGLYTDGSPLPDNVLDELSTGDAKYEYINRVFF
jgi:hypothetical protein